LYDTLLSADYMVGDSDTFAALIVERLNLPTPDPAWRRALPNHAVVPHFLRVNRSLAEAPTMLEPVSFRMDPNPRDPMFPRYLQSLVHFQGQDRPMKAHGNVFTITDMDTLVENLFRRGVAFRSAPPSDDFPGHRIWIGSTPEHPEYVADHDGGLMVEVMTSLSVSAKLDTAPVAESVAPAEGAMVRVVNRGFVVRDLDAVCSLWSKNLLFEPTGGITNHEDEGIRRARFTFDVALSSTFDILAPTSGTSEVGTFVSTWGPGPYYARIAVAGMEAKAAELKERRTPFTTKTATSASPARLVVDPSAVAGALFEFVDIADVE
jgi:hypothetical protein